MHNVVKLVGMRHSGSSHLVCALLLFFLLSHFVVPSLSTMESLAGEWVGVYEVAGRITFIQVRFERDGGQGMAAIREELAFGLPITASQLEGSRVRFDLRRGSDTLSFDGELSGGKMMGTVQRGTVRGTFELMRVVEMRPETYHRFIGNYRVGPNRTLLFGRFGAGGPLYYFEQDRFVFIYPVSDAAFYSECGEEIVFAGVGEQATSLSLRRVDSPATTGQRVEPYKQEEVSWRNGSVTLRGTLMTPLGSGPHPAVILLHGSGPDTRDSYLPIADYFARNGVAALAFDKRTQGYDTAGRGRRSYADLAADTLAGVEMLRRQDGIDPQWVGVWGLSEGGWVAPLAASRSQHVAFVIAVSSSGVQPARQELWFQENNLRHAGAVEPVIDTLIKAWKLIADARRLPLPAAVKENVYLLSDVHYDPVPVLEAVTQPMLAIWGGVDKIVPVRESALITEQALTRGGNHDYDLRIFPGADHSLTLSPTGFSYEPRQRLEYAPGFLNTMATWIILHRAAGRLSAGSHAQVAGRIEMATTERVPIRNVYDVGWYGSAPVQAILLCVFLLTFGSAVIVWPLGWLIRRAHDRPATASRAVGRVRRLVDVLAALDLVVLSGFVTSVLLVFNSGAQELLLFHGWPPTWIALVVFSYLSTLLVVWLALLTLSVWQDGSWTRAARVRLAFVVLVAALFVPFLVYWNLLGF